MAEGTDYKKTLMLPRTAFPMKAHLAQREPETLAAWKKGRIYQKMVAAAAERGGEPFLFHDGPPYANGHLHHGHILNKVLKDIVVKSRNMTGSPCEYVPGWDCHGLPIEHAVEKEIGREAARSDPQGLRRKCREFALKWVNIQRDEFERLGGMGEWDSPYLTMTPEYEALIEREFGKFVETGAVYQGKKPVLWCHVCETALADAEVEYQQSVSPSVYVKFPFKTGFGERIPELAGREGAVVIWTTTPWTLPANLAISLHPDETYVAEDVDGETWILAEKLFDGFHEEVGREPGDIFARFIGKALDGAVCSHPFIDRESLVIVGEHVTMDAGTGCVHTAPGHGEEDFDIGLKYGLDAYAPVNEQGKFTSDVPEFQGRLVFDCDEDIVALLEERGALIARKDFEHQYPHCWRSHNPVIFRATPQWFISVDKTGLRKAALEAIDGVKFIPAWGRDRIGGMLKSRPDWCISRQRHWGVPIVALTCRDCGEAATTRELVDHVASVFEKDGADAWFDRDLADLTPDGFSCPKCGGTSFDKVRDILDVWFDSGTSYAAVMEKRYGYKRPVDLYLEGSDQHRGWFQSSLLASVGTRGQAPYRAVLTHGFVVDGNGRKLSKSLGNFIPPDRLLRRYGAELMRLWTAAQDYRDDIRLSDEILKRLVDSYRKMRNTLRFMLGVVSDMDPDSDMVEHDELLPPDRWALHRFGEVVSKVRNAYTEYEFHSVVRTLLDFMTTELSSFYLDIGKDRLYCDLADGMRRRSVQTVIYRILKDTIILLAPILSFTAEEAWGHLPGKEGNPESVFLTAF
ncbi:MAG: isoleucine--tRNA ligase, partial [Deltaproteobacteria bacterium]|nr:isoleucine--tRNA ligase [Deltaproteobacteria bacterium]